MYDKGLFYPWVPKPVQIALIVLFLIPFLAVGAIYSTNSISMYSGLGILQEDITFLNNASTIGLVLSIFLLFPIRLYFRSKEIMVTSLLALAAISLAIPNCENIYLLTLLSLLAGFFKMQGMIMVMLPIMVIIAPDGDRGKFYAVFYPLSIGSGQITGYLAAQLAYDLDWHYVYLMAAVGMFVCALIAIALMHNKRAGKQVRTKNLDYLSITFFITALFALNYGTTYARQQGWFASFPIKASLGVFVISTILFLYRQSVHPKPILSFSVFKKRSTLTAILVIFLMGMFVSTSAIQSAFTTLLRYDAPTNGLIGLAGVPGIVAGGFIAAFWFKKNWSMKSLLFLAFVAAQLSIVLLYFLIAPTIEIESLILPQVLRGMGMTLVYIGASFYFASKLSPPEFISSISILISFRSLIGTAFFGAVFSSAMYILQLYGISDLAGNMDALDVFGTMRGGGVQLYTAVQAQASLIAIKELLGYIAIAGFLILVYIALHPFERPHHRKLIFYLKRFGWDNAPDQPREPTKEGLGETAAALAP